MKNIDQMAVNTIRILSAEAVQKANSGHPGLPMGAAPMAYSLWAKQLKHNPAHPGWQDRDRFILSAGHGSMLLYSLLHLAGYGLSLEDLQNFRQWGSKTPGHPEYGHTVGVEVTTGPLGQGIANGVGMAMAEAYLAAKFNRPGYPVVDHCTYVLSGDGCMMEGVAAEAVSLAGTLRLGKLIVLYDSNRITIEGDTDIAFTEDTGLRFKAYGWQVLEVEDGNDIDAIGRALQQAKAEDGKPSLIIVRTQIGYGCPGKQGKASCHGEPLGAENIAATKAFLEWEGLEAFHVPERVGQHFDNLKRAGEEKENAWNAMFAVYAGEFPELAREWKQWFGPDSSDSMDLQALVQWEELWKAGEKPEATRSSSGEILNLLASRVPNLIGGSADLAPSTKTLMKGREDFSAGKPAGANLHFGVREHAMAAIANGMAVHGGLLPYVSTFMVFSDYMKPSIRLSSLMRLPVVYILTHDSIGVGEDGPTHQPIEHLASLRSIPGLTVFRPADRRETAAGWAAAVTRKDSPTVLVLSRQNLPQLPGTGNEALKGGYVLLDSGRQEPDVILLASGSEVQLVYEAGRQLIGRGVAARVVSMPSWELFEEQPPEYRHSVLPPKIGKRLAVEAGASFGWHRYTGLDGEIIAVDTFGASAPAERLFKEFGFTVEHVAEKALELLQHL